MTGVRGETRHNTKREKNYYLDRYIMQAVCLERLTWEVCGTIDEKDLAKSEYLKKYG